MTVPRTENLDPAEHRALVEGLPHRLSALVSDSVLTPTEAHQCLQHAREVLIPRLTPTTDRSLALGRSPGQPDARLDLALACPPRPWQRHPKGGRVCGSPRGTCGPGCWPALGGVHTGPLQQIFTASDTGPVIGVLVDSAMIVVGVMLRGEGDGRALPAQVRAAIADVCPGVPVSACLLPCPSDN